MSCRVFLAGVIQGSRADEGIHDQRYRDAIRSALRTSNPDVETVDPHAEHPDRLCWSRAEQRSMFLRYVREAASCDVLIAYLPEASMGTAIEMYAAFRAGVPVLTVTQLLGNWAVFSLSARTFRTLDELLFFIGSAEFRKLLSPFDRDR